MRNFTLLLGVLFFTNSAIAQQIGQIVIGTGSITAKVDDQVTDFSNVFSFVTRELSKSGMAYSESDAANFLLHTTITYGYEKDIDINGMPLKAAEVEFDFDIKDRNGEVSFGRYSTVIPESGENAKVLIRNSTKQLRKNSSDFQKFLKDSQDKIYSYYKSNCSRLISEAKRHVETENFDAAILQLGQIPSEVDCYSEASKELINAFQLKLDRSCEVLVQECKILADQNALDQAYDKALLIPQNSRCAGQVEEVLDDIAHQACEQFILQAEAYYANKEFDKAVACLAGLETVSQDCAQRKTALERKMKATLDAIAKRNWEFKMQQYNDKKAERKAKFDQEVSVQNREMTMKEKEQSARLEMDKIQMGYSHEEKMKQMDKDAEVRAKELEVAPELEKYRTRRAIEISKNQQAVESLRIKETATVYRALLGA